MSEDLKQKRRRAFKTYLLVMGSLLTLTLASVIATMTWMFVQAVDDSKSTLMGLKAYRYMSSMRTSTARIEALKEEYRSNILQNKKPDLEDLEIELAGVEEAMLGIAGESKQLDFLTTAGEPFVAIAEKFKVLNDDFINTQKARVDLDAVNAKWGAIKAQAAEGLQKADAIQQLLDQLFDNGFQRTLYYEALIKMITLAASVIVVIIAVFASLVIRASLKMVTESTGQITEKSETVLQASNTISQSAVQLSELVTEQTSSVHEISVTLTELTEMVDKTVSNMNDTSKMAESTKSSSAEGTHAMLAVQSSMQEMRTNNEQLKTKITENNNRIAGINQVIQEIANKTQVINDIVFQTKLLSFNASVEAARAGEHGKGFAVVAEEVGNLATMSGKAASEIREYLDQGAKSISDIIADSNRVFSEVIAQSESKVANGESRVNQCNEVIQSIAKQAEKMGAMMLEVKNAANEQSTGIRNISQAMNQLQTSTQMASNLADDSAEQARLLGESYQGLNTSIQTLQVAVEGGTLQADTEKPNNVVTLDQKKKPEFRQPTKLAS